MNLDRRLALSAVALAGVAACTVAQTAGIQPVFNAIQFVLPLEKALAVGLSIAVPGRGSHTTPDQRTDVADGAEI